MNGEYPREPPQTLKCQTSQPPSFHSRIPVPTAAVHFPMRRWGSLTIPEEVVPFRKFSRITLDANHNHTGFGKTLQRGYSFMERGETKRGAHGARPSAVAPRPKLVITEPRNLGALTRVSPKSPNRNASLALSIASPRTTPTRSPLTDFPKTPPSSPDTRIKSYRDWDLDSITSSTSCLSVASCDHASVAHNGTTYSGKTKRYVVHCSEHSGQTGDEYLTPTQRAHREVKKLKSLLQQTHRELDVKNVDILRLTKEVVELRLYKAALSSPEDKSNSSSDAAVTVREVLDDDDVDCVVGNHILADRTSSCADSGHYDDLTNSSVHSKESVNVGDDNLSPYKAKTPVETADKAVTADFGPRDPHSEHQRLVVEYERQLQDLIRTHENECHLMKQRHNDKVDELLQRLSDVNARYWELLPDLESAKERIKELEKQLDELAKDLEHKESYFKLYSEGGQAVGLTNSHEGSPITHQPLTRVSVPELLHQLEVTRNELDKVKDLEYASTSNNVQPLLSAKEAVSLWVLGARKAMYKQLVEARSKNKVDPEVTLQFLKSAIYYFLTDRENNQGHLRAIQSILGFTPSEISNIDKARFTF